MDGWIHKHCWLGASGENRVFFLSSRGDNSLGLADSHRVVLAEAVFLSLEVSHVWLHQSLLSSPYFDNSLSGKSEAVPKCNFGHICCPWMGLWKVCDVAFKGALGLYPVQKQRGFGPNWSWQRPNSTPSLSMSNIEHILGHICPSVSWICCWQPYKCWDDHARHYVHLKMVLNSCGA